MLRGVFENFGAVDDVVTFPGRMYAFVNFKEAADAAKAAEDMQVNSGGGGVWGWAGVSVQQAFSYSEAHRD